MLDRDARRELLTLSKTNGDTVARHLVMAGVLLDDDPERAYEHAQAAGRGAGRVATAREAVAITAYATGRFAEALKELRAVRRLAGRDDHRVMEADCERGLGRPERALSVIAETDTTVLSDAEKAELAIVASGARADLGENEAGLLILRTVQLDAIKDPAIRSRLDSVIADRLDEVGRSDEATELRGRITVPTDDASDSFDVIDLQPEDIDDEPPARPAAPQETVEPDAEGDSTAADEDSTEESSSTPTGDEDTGGPELESEESAEADSEPVPEAEAGRLGEPEADSEPVAEPEADVESVPTSEENAEDEPVSEVNAEADHVPVVEAEHDAEAEPEAEQGMLDLGFDLGGDGPQDERPADEERGSGTMDR
ncbi:hypothetical protein ACPYO6_15880 [Georgenia sp. Z1344]|uniref:hypothetical protein n=1 Tax=Georgenia sp. Z1344 TaxID=3416706 RepID=UPI003CE6E5E2